jgi:hypothetical protein
MTNSLSITHKGCTFFGSSEEEIKKRIKDFDFERSIFYRSSVYTYSCFARVLEDNSVEFTQRFNNGEEKRITGFKDKKEFWDNL